MRSLFCVAHWSIARGTCRHIAGVRRCVHFTAAQRYRPSLVYHGDAQYPANRACSNLACFANPGCSRSWTTELAYVARCSECSANQLTLMVVAIITSWAVSCLKESPPSHAPLPPSRVPPSHAPLPPSHEPSLVQPGLEKKS